MAGSPVPKEREVVVDLANERIILATSAKSAEARRRIASELPSADEFVDPRHRVIHAALLRMASSGLAWSEDTLASLAGGNDFGGFAYVRKLLENYDPNLNIDHHVDRLRHDSARLEILKTQLPELSAALEDPGGSPAEIERVASAILSRARSIAGGRHFIRGGDELIDGFYQTLRLRTAMRGWKELTGFELLDRMIRRGLKSKTISVVVGRPGMGKTTFIANLLRLRVAMERPTFVCGWEMEAEEDYLEMMVSAETGIPSDVLYERPGELSVEDKDRVARAAERYRRRDLIEFQSDPFDTAKRASRFEDLNERNLDVFEATVARASSTKTVVVVDVVGNMLVDRSPDRVTAALTRIRKIAKRYDVHLMLLHHIGRSGADGPPTLETIKNSGGFEETADLVLGLDRPILRTTAARRRKMSDVLDVRILKQRKGPAPLCARYRFDGSRYALTGEVEVDLAMMEKNEDEQEVPRR